MSDISVDKFVEVDTKLAKVYLQTISSDIHSLGLEDFEVGNYDHDKCHNKLYFVDYKKAINKLLQNPSSHNSVSDEMYYKLARKVEGNAELFAQLEFMTRKIPISETKNYQIKLIVQNLLHWSTKIGEFNKLEDIEQIIMNEKTPLSSLGCLASLLCIGKSCVIESTKETAAVCHLLTKLCHEVGMKNVYLLLVQDPTNIKALRMSQAIDLNNIECLVQGGAGIVTGHADIDSAVDAFLTSTTMLPWRLRRLLVQENVYGSFKKTLSWKTNLKQTSDDNCQPIIDCYSSKCTDLLIYDEKVFLLNYVGSLDDLHEMAKFAIIVEAYRTTKELLSLINLYKPNSLSVWSSDIAEANEIAFGVDTSIIWINDINNFDGSPKTAQAFYSNLLLDHRIKRLYKTEDKENFSKVRNNWLKFNINERRDRMMKAIEGRSFEDNKFAMDIARELRLGIFKDSNKFVEIEGSRMCIGIQEPVGTIVTSVNCVEKLVDVIKSSIYGNGVTVDVLHWIEPNDFENLSKLIKSLKKEGVPIIVNGSLTSGDFLEIKSPYLMYKTRVIWTNFGTIFAN